MREPRNDTLERSPKPVRAEQSSQRTCIVSRRTAPRDELIRLALSPDGEVAPDVRARAPGRGAWIGVGRAELDAAQAFLAGNFALTIETPDAIALSRDSGDLDLHSSTLSAGSEGLTCGARRAIEPATLR